MTRLGRPWWLAGAAAVLTAVVLGVAIGPVSLAPMAVARELLDHVPGVDIRSGLDARDAAIVWELRFPRVVLALVVGAMLAGCGAAYQGVFRNALADPYLMGAAAGAGLGVTITIVTRGGPASALLPVSAFAGAMLAVALTYVLGTAGGGGSAAGLILAGVAVTSFLTALQTYFQQQHQDSIREVYSWILGRLTTAGWGEVRTAVPYAVVTGVVLLTQRRRLDVLAVGDEEAASLGIDPRRARLLIVTAASLGTAAAVSVSGLIGFVGIIVPHTVRLLAGSSYRVVLPLSLLFGGAFLIAADLLARTAVSPAEIPIGVVTAFFGAPFFVLVLRTSKRLVP
ncbi:MAG TPA: iron ABC transporter permease [Acidimicrobiales bacterium]|nr:iron ABC transporter permease [Acidimicrobiales bacterium]